jgi:hypothetical protein
MLLRSIFSIALIMIAPMASALSFSELCRTTNQSGARNTVDILITAVGLEPGRDLETCVKAQAKLLKMTVLSLGATKFTPPFESRALNPLTDLSPLTTLPQITELELRLNNLTSPH